MRLAIIFTSLVTRCAIAGDTAQKVIPPAAETPNFAATMLPTLGSLALVIIAIFATGFFLRRMNPNLKQGSALLQTVAQIAVGPKEKVAVIQFQGELLVLGITASQITLLSKGVPNDAIGQSAGAPSESALVAKWLARVRPEKSDAGKSGAER